MYYLCARNHMCFQIWTRAVFPVTIQRRSRYSPISQTKIGFTFLGQCLLVLPQFSDRVIQVAVDQDWQSPCESFVVSTTSYSGHLPEPNRERSLLSNNTDWLQVFPAQDSDEACGFASPKYSHWPTVRRLDLMYPTSKSKCSCAI